jgi:hypothetical protein
MSCYFGAANSEKIQQASLLARVPEYLNQFGKSENVGDGSLNLQRNAYWVLKHNFFHFNQVLFKL